MYAKCARAGVADADQVLRDAVKAVFRAEKCRERDTRCSREQIGRVTQPRIDGRGMTHQPHAPAAERFPVRIVEDIEASTHEYSQIGVVQ